ncbi:MAG TPA: sigma-70 family RNA polymerase sigma factor [Ktedonobacterales bacterium]|nr:sigma-70 family RNA polymerase sigma factor [Ktedonobacterales bacterium]
MSPVHWPPSAHDFERLGRQAGQARQRLIRFARAYGLPTETAEDVAQETLLEAWRHLDRLHTPEGLDSWLNAICRNVCLRHLRSAALWARQQVSLGVVPSPAEDDQEGENAWQTPDPSALDLAEELDRQDLHILLDRALEQLPADARQLVELCYLEEQPQPDVALRLGLTLSALEARLHRARKQLRHILNGVLRSEAEAFGLMLDDAALAGWHETRLWCMACGHVRLHGTFEPLPDGGVNLHMRCPGCSFEVNSGGVVPLEGLRSFRPALKRMWQHVTPYVTEGLIMGSQACPRCGARLSVRLSGPGTQADNHGRSGVNVVMDCPRCGSHSDANAAMLVLLHPDAQRFMIRHPRWHSEPEILLEHLGRPALQIQLMDALSAARLTILLDRQTLHVLAGANSALHP